MDEHLLLESSYSGPGPLCQLLKQAYKTVNSGIDLLIGQLVCGRVQILHISLQHLSAGVEG